MVYASLGDAEVYTYFKCWFSRWIYSASWLFHSFTHWFLGSNEISRLTCFSELILPHDGGIGRDRSYGVTAVSPHRAFIFRCIGRISISKSQCPLSTWQRSPHRKMLPPYAYLRVAGLMLGIIANVLSTR